MTLAGVVRSALPLRIRVFVRHARAVAVFLVRPRTDWRTPLGPVLLGAAELVLRAPELADAEAWRVQRLAERDRLQPWFPVEGDWDRAHTPLVWAEQVVGLRAAARLGRARPRVALLDGRLVGQVGVDAVDWGNATGELSAWVCEHPLGLQFARLAVALVSLDALTGPAPLDRLLAPVAVGNRAPGLVLAGVGFRREAVLRRYRETGSGRADHEVWVLHRTPAALTALRELVAAEQQRPSTARRAAGLARHPVGTRPAPAGPSAARAALVARVLIRVVVGLARRRRRPVTDWKAPLGPFDVGGQELVLRVPRDEDATAWTALRLRNRDRLEPWFPEAQDWAARQSAVEWVQQGQRLRAAARRGVARPRVVELDGVLRGQCGVVAVDGGTGTAELELWLDRDVVGHDVSRLACVAVSLDALTCAQPAERVQVPVPEGATAARAVLRAAGFAEEGRLRAHRATSAGKADHVLFVLHRDDATIAALRAALVGAPPCR